MSKNGFLTDAELTPVQGNMQLANGTANAFKAMRSEATAQGRVIAIASPAGAYRDDFMDRDMRIHPRKYNLNPLSTASLAPIGKSLHTEGIAVDFIGDLLWVKKNGHKWGFSFPLKNDPNHGVHDKVTAIGSPISIGKNEMNIIYTPKNRAGTPASPDSYMVAIVDRTTGEFTVFDADAVTDAAMAGALMRILGTYIPGYNNFSNAPGKVTNAQWTAIKDSQAKRKIQYLNETKGIVSAPSTYTISPETISAIGAEVIRQQKLAGN